MRGLPEASGIPFNSSNGAVCLLSYDGSVEILDSRGASFFFCYFPDSIKDALSSGLRWQTMRDGSRPTALTFCPYDNSVYVGFAFGGETLAPELILSQT